MRMIVALLALCLSALAAPAGSGEASSRAPAPPPLLAGYFLEPGTAWEIRDVCCSDTVVFGDAPQGRLETGYARHAHWLRIDPGGREGVLVLDAAVDEADLFAVDRATGRIERMQAGDTRPASVRPILSPRAAFPIAGDDRREFYLRIVQPTAISIGFDLPQRAAFEARTERRALLRTGFVGAVLMMVVFNVVLSVFSRDITFLLNALTILPLLMLDLYLTGVGPTYLWGETPGLSNTLMCVGIIAPVIFGGLFFHAFMSGGARGDSPALKLFFVSPAIGIVLLALLPFVAYWRLQPAILALAVLMISIQLCVCVFEAWKGSRRAATLLVPLIGGILPGVALTALQKIAGVDFGSLNEHLLEITLVFEALFFSLALAYRFRIAQEERGELQRAYLAHVGESERRLLAAVDEERARIATDMHDTAGQNMVAVVSRLARLKRKVAQAPEIASELGEVADVAREMVADIRRISHDLHPVALRQLGFGKALETLAERFGAAGQIDVQLDNDLPDGAISPDQEQHLYRIVQELVTNAARHSKGTVCRVRIARNGAGVAVSVSDDGSGIRADAAAKGAPSGLGLELVGQRVRFLNGEWGWRSGDKGAVFDLRFPSPSQAARG